MDLRTELNRYLRNVRVNLKLDPASETEIISELEAHVEDRYQEMRKAGLSDEEAIQSALRLLGSAKTVARQIYETHSQGTWRQALLAGMPHLFFAALLALNWLNGLAWVPVMLVFVAAIVLYGLLHGKPGWLFPWLGYALLPVVGAGVALFYLPQGWRLATLFLYVPLVVWLCCFIAIKFIRRDWVYSALMLLPVPTFIGWYMAGSETSTADLRLGFLQGFAPWTGLTFLLLGASAALIVRMKSRALRIAAMILSGLASAAVVAQASDKLGMASFLGLAVMLLVLVVAPALVDWRLSRGLPR